MNNSWTGDRNNAEEARPPLVWPSSSSAAPGTRVASINRRELIISVILFILTLLTTLVHGVDLARNFQAGGQTYFSLLELPRELLRNPSLIWLGLPFSATLLLILLTHEMGHYVACLYYRMNTTPPYFLPVPLISLVGTLGAFIRIRSPFASRRALFDVGAAGPIAGFIVLLPALIYGIQHSTVVPVVPAEDTFISFNNFGTPLIFRWLWQLLQSPYSKMTHTINLHPVGWAAWFGLFATCLNLLPIGQLDGGHVTYALFGARGHRWISIAALASLVPLSVPAMPAPSYLVFAVVLLIIGLRHPQTIDEQKPIGPARGFIGVLALLIFLSCFIPIPFSLK